MVRVLHYIGLLEFGGSQSFVMEIYRKIDRSKLQFDFVTFPNQKSGFYDEIVKLGGRVYESPRYNGKNHFAFVKWWDDFFKKHTEYKVFHTHVRSVATICISIAHKYNRFAVAHSHSTSNGHGLLSCVKDAMQLPVRYQADFLLACSDAAGQWMFGNDVYKRKNYSVISNAIDAERFDYNEKVRNKIRKELGVEEKIVIGHVGRMTEPKNHAFLIDIFENLVKINENVALLLIGDGILKKRIEDEVKLRNLQEKVIFLGSRSNTQDYYQAMDVFVFPSLWEGLGIAVIEAQTSGLPCLVSNRIPKEIDIKAGLIHSFSLEQGAQKWADKILKISTSVRKGQVQIIRDAGYDVTENALRMQEFYTNIDARMRE